LSALKYVALGSRWIDAELRWNVGRLEWATAANGIGEAKKGGTAPCSALCEAFHKADYAKSLIMESSWPEPTQRASGQGQTRIPAFA
jgi:hypothetical protein